MSPDGIRSSHSSTPGSGAPGSGSQVEVDVLAAMRKPGALYWFLLLVCGSLFMVGMALWAYQMTRGMGVAGITHPVGWGVYITNFVFWVGIAHSGTLISAVLFLFRAGFRRSFNRSAEAMTVFAVMTAGLFPLIHLGRSWYFFWLFPYPTQRLLWTNFKSPLMWDVFAVSTYFTVSAVFFFIGMVPDLAIVKRFSSGVRKWFYSALSLGWKGSQVQWKHYNQLYMFLASFATPLVVSVHSVVSWDFAMSIVPGWHTTIFAPYFVAGAIFSGTAMVITLVVPMRRILKLERYITIDHFESIAKILLFTSLIVTYAYIVEYGLAFYSGSVYEIGIFKYRTFGHYRFYYYGMLLFNALVPMTLFVRSLRRNLPYLFILSILVNIGMYLERFVIIVSSLAKEYSPYAWGTYKPTMVEVGITLGSFGFFFTMFLLFTKLLPVLSVTEIKEESH
ncbi:MAG: hydrogenase [Candidatus Latescibacteria bacterium]|nr:hydrogenase [Candidatus Latescibacterota bacterium]NIM22151.1 hydrogenase [Candidatus Latescibacterota bacterium]NIM64701.1 hydrogenase [Candidatus Latescibacterota bacterium]NIO01211.1 hydrogenase [Candidatus Latescibacterota bacterium]NIO27596.1 hydrogenase [Candidatus Latescibacterota bacterium]